MNKNIDEDFNDLIEEFDEDVFIILIENDNLTVSEIKLTKIRKSLNAIVYAVKKSCLDAEVKYNLQHFLKYGIISIEVETGTSDWFEVSSKKFIDCIQYTTEFKFFQIANERMKMEFIFHDVFTNVTIEESQ